MIQTSTLKFLRDLKKNNNKPWFDANRSRYESAKKDYENFVQQLIDRHGKKDATISGLVAKDCLFRINRDIRFSKDKTPYKTNFGASINKGGRKAMHSAGYYFHLEPGECFAGGGLYVPMPETLAKVRQEIDYNLDAFKRIVESKKFKSVLGGLDMSSEFSLSRVPKGYTPDNPAADYLKLKSFIAFVKVEDKDIVSKELVKKVLASFEAIQPLLEFLNKATD